MRGITVTHVIKVSPEGKQARCVVLGLGIGSALRGYLFVGAAADAILADPQAVARFQPKSSVNVVGRGPYIFVPAFNIKISPE